MKRHSALHHLLQEHSMKKLSNQYCVIPFKKIQLTDRQGINVKFYISSAPHIQVKINNESAQNIAEKWLHKSWSSLDEYAAVKNARLFYFDASDASQNAIICVCCDFQKRFICSDAVALAHVQQLYEIPTEHQVI